MGNKINMIATRKINESKGFEFIGSYPTDNNIEDQLKNEEYTGFICKIPYPDINNMIKVLITYNNIING